MTNPSVIVRAALATGLVAGLAACSRADSAAPLATVSFSASKQSVPLGSPLDLNYRFDVAPNAAFAGDYRVFMHVLDDRGQVIWLDDHDPPQPTSTWRPGQRIEYSRTRFVPVFPYVGPATVVVGLYRENERLPLQGADPADRESTTREYRVGALELLPTLENVFLIKRSGWHPVEFSPNDPLLDWEWTQRSAALSFRNPRRDITFYLEYDARPDVFADQPQQVTVYSGNEAAFRFAADQKDLALLRIPITAAQLGGEEMAELRIDVDRTFVPAELPGGGRDTRELGIRVYHTYVEVR